MPDKVNKDLTVHMPAEELWLWQLAQGLTNRQAADVMGVSERHYWDLLHAKVVEHNYAVEPTTAHLLQLARRRYGRGLAGTAKLARCSPPTLHKWERAADQRLVDFWIKKGFSGFTIRQG